MAKKMSCTLGIEIPSSCVCTAMSYMMERILEEYQSGLWKRILVISNDNVWKDVLTCGKEFRTFVKEEYDPDSSEESMDKTCIVLFSDGKVVDYYETMENVSKIWSTIKAQGLVC